MKYNLCSTALFALLMLSHSNVSALLDVPELQPKAGQAQMDSAYDMTLGNADLIAAQQFGQPQLGKANLNIIVEPATQQVLVTLTTTSQDLLGFERDTLTEADKKTLATMQQTLGNWQNLFSFNAPSHCELRAKHLELLPEDPEQHLVSKASLYSEAEMTWALSCENPDRITSVNITLFKAYPNHFKILHTDWLTATQAGNQELSADGVVKLTHP